MGGGTPARVAAAVRRHVDTIDVAGVAFRISCRYPKPGFWARSRPEFLTTRPPDVVVAITYDEGFRRRARRPAGEDTVADAPYVRRRGRGLLVTTGYYRATVDIRSGRVAVRMAAGFGVAGLIRTLAALWLLDRGTVLLRAVRLGRDGATLACGVPEAARSLARGAAVAGYLAVTPRPDGVAARLTPFLEGEKPPRARPEARVRTLWVPGADAGPTRPAGVARAVAVLLPAIWQADRRRGAVVRTLDLATRIVTALRRDEVGARTSRREGVAVG